MGLGLAQFLPAVLPMVLPLSPWMVAAIAKPMLCSFSDQQPPPSLHQFPEYLHTV